MNDAARMQGRDIILAVGAALIWGATFPVSALALETTPPIFFTFLRFLCAGAFALVIPRPAIAWPTLIVIGLLLGAAQFGLMFVAMTQGISAGLASLLVHTQAFFTIIIAMAIFGERLSQRQILALGLAAAGLGCLVVNRAEAGALGGLGLILLAALCGASGNNILKSLGSKPHDSKPGDGKATQPVNMLSVSVWMSLVAPLPLFGLSLLLESDGSVVALTATISWTTVGAVAYSAILATVMVFALWGRLLVTYPAAMVAPFFLLVPVFGISLSALTLGERLSSLQITGAALIFIGLAMALWPNRGTGHRTNDTTSRPAS